MNIRRNTIKGSLVVSGALGLVQTKWAKPLVESIILPAYAQTSPRLELDSIANQLITPQTQPSDMATGNIFWAEYDLASFTGENISSEANYTITQGQEIFNTNAAAIADLRVAGPRIYIYTEGESGANAMDFPASANGVYSITVTVTNPDNESASVSFNLTLSGF